MLSLWGSPLFDVSSSLVRAIHEEKTESYPVNITEDDSSYTLTVTVPGLTSDDIQLDVTATAVHIAGQRTPTVPEGFKTIRSERRTLRINRAVRFRRRLDPDAVEATLQDGVLKVVLPWSTSEHSRRIRINE